MELERGGGAGLALRFRGGFLPDGGPCFGKIGGEFAERRAEVAEAGNQCQNQRPVRRPLVSRLCRLRQVQQASFELL